MYKTVEKLHCSERSVSDNLRNSSFIESGASFWRALSTTFTGSSSISCSIVSQPNFCICGSEGASKQLFVATLAAQLCSFCIFCRVIVTTQIHTGQKYLKEGSIRLGDDTYMMLSKIGLFLNSLSPNQMSSQQDPPLMKDVEF